MCPRAQGDHQHSLYSVPGWAFWGHPEVYESLGATGSSLGPWGPSRAPWGILMFLGGSFRFQVICGDGGPKGP